MHRLCNYSQTRVGLATHEEAGILGENKYWHIFIIQSLKNVNL